MNQRSMMAGAACEGFGPHRTLPLGVGGCPAELRPLFLRRGRGGHCRDFSGELYGGGHAWEAVVRRLHEEGWTVHTRVGWIVEARRGRDFGQAAALTRDAAFAELHSLVQLDAEPSPP